MAVTTAPGKPGIEPRWTSSAKLGIGTAMTADSNVWFTLSHGIINEVYYPRIDIANIRDMGLLVTDGKEFFSEERRHARHDYALLGDGVMAYRLTNTCLQDTYVIEKIIITDPHRNVLLQKVTFTPLKGALEDYHVYLLLAPHIANSGYGNTGWTGEYKGTPMLFAKRAGIALACACSVPFLGMNCGYVGTSDTWQDVHVNKRMTKFYNHVEEGNIALGAEIDLKACKGEFVLALGFAPYPEEAALQVRAAQFHGFDRALRDYVASWNQMQSFCSSLAEIDKEGSRFYRLSLSILKSHQGKHFSGSVIASLSIPWGDAKGDTELGGYHLIWPRDQVQAAEAFLAAGDIESARQILLFLMCAQEEDGHWMQCLWEDGSAYWQRLQLDETALPILLADHFQRLNKLETTSPIPMAKKAARFLIQHGPATEQDRWEEGSGYTPFTIATQIAALLAAADFFEADEQTAAARYLREIADCWNDHIEHWLYVKDTPLAKRLGVEGYYVRIAPVNRCENEQGGNDKIVIANRPAGQNLFPYTDIVSVDALALVRYGLRAADDPRILNTVKVIDALLKTETTKGPVWHRYNEDGYGEHRDGSPFDGAGIGRGWPLLVGERAHYELARGNREEAMKLLRTLANLAGVGGLFPEQTWDTADIPHRSLFNGHSTGAAKPLVWTHAEYITLLRSLKEGKIFGMPPQTEQRYLKDKKKSTIHLWRLDHQDNKMPVGKKLRIQSRHPGKVRWTLDEWCHTQESELEHLPELDIYYLDLPTDKMAKGTQALFTFHWSQKNQWEGRDFGVTIA